jgi:hypothetical protein
MTDDLRQRIYDAIRPTMLLGLQDAELDGPGGAQRIGEWAEWIATTIAAELDQVRAERDWATGEMQRHQHDAESAIERYVNVAMANTDLITEQARLRAAEQRIRQLAAELIEGGRCWGASVPDIDRRFRAALDSPAAEQRQCVAGQNMEDCPDGVHINPAYPWICPGPAADQQPGTCTATITGWRDRTIHCTLPAGHEDPSADWPDYHAGPEEPDGSSLRWLDEAEGATPHTTEGANSQ